MLRGWDVVLTPEGDGDFRLAARRALSQGGWATVELGRFRLVGEPPAQLRSVGELEVHCAFHAVVDPAEAMDAVRELTGWLASGDAALQPRPGRRTASGPRRRVRPGG